MRTLFALLSATSLAVYAQSPQPVSVSGVVNAASFGQGPIAPGTIVSIFGKGLAGRTASASSLPLPQTLDGTSVTLNGQVMPLFFASPGQINAQLPFSVPNGPAVLKVQNSSGSTGGLTISVAAASPAVFTTTADGKGSAISVHADFRLVQKLSGQNASTGETIVLFCTGLGAVDSFSTAGAAGPSSPLARTTQKTSVLMDGRPAQVSFAGLAPGFAGLYQINLVVPEGVGGDVVTTVNVGNATSNPVNINVRGTYTLGASYSGSINYRTGEKFQVVMNSFSSLSASTFTASYSVLNGNSALDRGSFQLQSTSTIFAGSGRSAVTGQQFVGILDTLDAGRSFFGYLYDTDSLEKVKDPNSWYASFTLDVNTPQPTPTPPVLSGVAASCGSLEGAVIFSGNTFLGRVTSNTFAADSIGNQFGSYGSQFSTTSIFNTFGSYGSQFSSTSAFNSLATDPPIISKGSAAAYLTTNQFKTPGLDPRALLSCIGR